MPSESTRPQPPVPTSVSDEARRYLGSTPYVEPKFPELDDVEGWLDLIAARDAELAQRFGGFELPVAADEVVIGGVRTDVLRAAEVSDAPDGPVYLSFHGGALAFGGGDACRLMGSVVAMSSGMVTWAPDYRMPPLHPYPARSTTPSPSTGSCSNNGRRSTSSSGEARPVATWRPPSW